MTAHHSIVKASRAYPSVNMATVGERLATLEVFAANNARRIDALHDAIHGGPSCEWSQSVRGRLHAVAENLATADKLIEALREARRMQGDQRKSRFTRWQWLYLAVCATLAAAAPYVVLLTR